MMHSGSGGQAVKKKVGVWGVWGLERVKEEEEEEEEEEYHSCIKRVEKEVKKR